MDLVTCYKTLENVQNERLVCVKHLLHFRRLHCWLLWLSVCMSVCQPVIWSTFVPSHFPAVRVAPSVTLHCAYCPSGTAFIQHDRTSFCSSFTSISPFIPIDPSVLSCHPLYFYPSYSCSLFFHFSRLPSISPFLCVVLCGHSSTKQHQKGGTAVPPSVGCFRRWSQRQERKKSRGEEGIGAELFWKVRELSKRRYYFVLRLLFKSEMKSLMAEMNLISYFKHNVMIRNVFSCSVCILL